ncbi:MAG: aldose 1-epimerase [Meiothermus sp.]|nr:aldose 1-epimerase [Meiothermus sp.]
MNLQILQNQRLRLTVAPELGASVVGLELHRQGFWLPVLRPTSPAALEERHSPDTSSYLLAPYSNRIRDGRFSFAGKTYLLRPNWVDGQQTIHGEVHGRPWMARRLEENRLLCTLDSRSLPDPNFPFPFTIEVQYRLLEEGVEILTRLQNAGAEPMPAGLGHHPYFVRYLGHSGEALLSFKAARVYLTDESRLPTRPAEAIPAELDFSRPKSLGQAFLDHVFAGWDGFLRLEWPGSGWCMELTADPVYSHLVLFTAPDGSLALEPVTHATDGFNLMAQGWPDTGVRVLEPGEELKGQIYIRLLSGC